MTSPRPDETDPESIYPPETARLLSWAAIRFIRAPSPRFFAWSAIAIGTAAALAVVAAFLVETDIMVRAGGELTSSLDARQAVSAIQGRVTAIRKRAGDRVSEDEVIATLDMDEAVERRAIGLAAALDDYEARAAAAAGTKDPLPTDFPVPELPLAPGPAVDSLIALRQEIRAAANVDDRLRDGLRKELAPLRKRADALRRKLAKIRKSKLRDMMALYSESAEEELGRIESQITTAENENRAKAELAGAALVKAIQTSKAALRAYLQDHTVRAPIAGEISRTLASVNSPVEAYRPIATIVPADSRLVAAIRVPSRAMASVATGKRIRYRMEAYPVQEYGAFEGRVLSFERSDQFNRDAAEARKRADLSEGTPYVGDYIVYGTVEPPKAYRGKSESLNLMVGMRFSADVIIDRKSIGRQFGEVVFRWKK